MKPWENNPDWRGGRVRSSARKEMWVLVVIALVWNGFTWSMTWFAAIPELDKGNQGAWFVVLFDLAGVGLAWMAIKAVVQWRRFGRTVLTLDPFPGSLGGDVGGEIDLPVRNPADGRFDLSLNCVHVTISHSSKGSNTRHEHVHWRERGEPLAEPFGSGTRLRFRFRVPDDLPQTGEPSNNYYQWVVHVQHPGLGLDRSFEIPVFNTDAPLETRRRLEYTPDRTTAPEIPAESVRVGREAGGLQLYYPLSRNRGMATVLIVFGALCAGVAWFLTGQVMLEFMGEDGLGLLFAGMVGFMALVFGAFGGLLLLLGFYELGNTLRVEVDHAGVRTLRRVYGIPFRRKVPLDGLQRLETKITSQTGQGAKAVIRYTLRLHLRGGRKLVVGDGIRGAPVAKQVAGLIRDACGLKED